MEDAEPPCLEDCLLREFFAEDAFEFVSDAVAANRIEIVQVALQKFERVRFDREIKARAIPYRAPDARGVINKALIVQDADKPGLEVG